MVDVINKITYVKYKYSEGKNSILNIKNKRRYRYKWSVFSNGLKYLYTKDLWTVCICYMRWYDYYCIL